MRRALFAFLLPPLVLAQTLTTPAEIRKDLAHLAETVKVKSSRPETLQDTSFNMEVELYEGEATFTLPLKVAAGTAAGAQTLVVNASYQSCNNKICLPPKTVKVELPVTVAK
jgi:hypothetical protein